MLFIFDMGGVVTKPDEMPDFFNWLNPELNAGTVAVIEALKKKHRVVCGTNTNASHFAIHAVRFTDADSLCASWKQFF